MAEDFFSAETLAECLVLAKQFCYFSDLHTNHCHLVQVKNIIFHTIRKSIAALYQSDGITSASLFFSYDAIVHEEKRNKIRKLKIVKRKKGYCMFFYGCISLPKTAPLIPSNQIRMYNFDINDWLN